MKTLRLTRVALLVLSIAGAWSVVSARQADQGDRDNYSREQAEVVARRLYDAVLGRPIDPAGLTQTVAELQRGNLRKHVDGLVGSSEFRQRTGRLQPAAILEQFYRALLGRPPDSGGVRTYLSDVERRRYAEVVVTIVESPEFENALPGGGRRPRAAGRGLPPPPERQWDPRTAIACQTAVLDEMRADRRSRVFVRFNETEAFGTGRDDQIRGSGVDLVEGDRRFSYACDVDRRNDSVQRATYSFEGAPWDPADRIPVLRACQDAVRRELGGSAGRDVVLETAGVMPFGRGAETIVGRARGGSLNRNPFDGREFDFTCEVDGGRVTRASVRPAR